MHKLLPLLFIVAAGILVTYWITRQSANFSFLGFASVQTEYRNIILPPPLRTATPVPPSPSPWLSGRPIATVHPVAPTPTPLRPGKPTARPVRGCLRDGTKCRQGEACCGFCGKNEKGTRVCMSVDVSKLCIPEGDSCHVWGKKCCQGSCKNVAFGIGYCDYKWQ